MRPPIRFLLAALALAACGGGDDDEATTTTSAAPAPTTTTAATSAPAPTTTSPPSTTCPAPTEGDTFAVVDLDGDGVDERFVSAGSGASVDIVEVRVLDGCAEVVATVDGQPAQFPIGGSVLQQVGLRCVPGLLVVHEATSPDGETYTLTSRSYELQDGELVEQAAESTEDLAADSPEVATAGSFDC